MTRPLRPASPNPSTWTPPVVQPEAAAIGAGPSQASAGRPPELGQAPAAPPLAGASAGRPESSTVPRRRRQSLPARTAAASERVGHPLAVTVPVIGSEGVASVHAPGEDVNVPGVAVALPPASIPPAAEVAQAAQELAGLEQRRSVLAARIEAVKQARLTAVGAGGGADSRTELGKLQGRLEHAAQTLQRLVADRAEQLGRLERAERQLASCERSLQVLTLGDAVSPGESSAIRPEAAPASPETSPAAALAPEDARIAVRDEGRFPASAEEIAARGRVQQLVVEQRAAKDRQAAAGETLRLARAEADRRTAEAEAIVQPERYMTMIEQSAVSGIDRHLRQLGLPPVDRAPGCRETDVRHERYVEHFTEIGEGGVRRMKPALLDRPTGAFAAFSAFCSANMRNEVIGDLLSSVLVGDKSAIEAALRAGGEGLEDALRQKIDTEFSVQMATTESLAEAAERHRPRATGRIRRRVLGTYVNRSDAVEMAMRGRMMMQLQEMPAHRAAIIDGGVMHGMALLSDVVDKHQRALAQAAQAAATVETAKAALRPAIQCSLDVDRQVGEARERLAGIVDARRRQVAAEMAEAKKDMGSSDAAVPRTVIVAPATTDAEARRLKLRGDAERHGDAVDQARDGLAEADESLRKAQGELRRCEDQLDTAAAARARGMAGSRREHAAQRDELSALRRELGELDARVEGARAALSSHPSRRAMVSDRAWERAVERHVEPDDASLRARARQTGYAGAYASTAELAQAVADIDAHLRQRPELQAVFQAKTPAAFERAVAALAGGVTDRVFGHGRAVGRGFSNDPDQTARPTTLTRSNYSLQLVQGQVLISHVYPYVPPRRLQSAD